MSAAEDLADEAWRIRARLLRERPSQSEFEKSAAKCFARLEKAVAVAKKGKDDHGLAYALIKLAHLRGDRDGREAAIELYQEAVDAGSRAKSGLLEGEALRHWADHLRHLDKLEEAQALYERALDCLHADPATTALSLGNAYRPMGILFTELKDSENAIRHWQRARELYVEAGIAAGIEECDANLKKLEDS